MKKVLLSCLLILIAGAGVSAEPLSPAAAVQGDIEREFAFRPWTPATEVLSGRLDRTRGYGRDLKVEYIEQGFQDRMSELPPAGVHPRVVMSPSDIQECRRLLLLGDAAPDYFRNTMEQLAKVAGQAHPARTQAPWMSPTTPLAQKALYALIMEDQLIGRQAAEDLLDHAKYMEGKIDEFDAQWGAAGLNDMMYSAPHTHNMGLGMAYDYAYEFLTNDERSYVRSVISKATKDRYISFMENPDHFNITNHLAFAQNWWLDSLAIEGEAGWDERVMKVGLHKVEAYINAVVSKKGFPFEGVKPSISPYAMLAAQRRGHRKVVQSDHLQAYTMNLLNGLYWTYDANSTTLGRWHGRRMMASDGDEMGVYPAPFLKFFYPQDTLIDTAWQAQGGAVRHANVDLVLMLGSGSLDAKGWQPTDPQLPAEVREKVPLTWVDPERGMMRTRSGWSPDDLVLRFEARANYYSDGHETIETFAIDFVSQGEEWTYYPGRYADSRQHGTPAIDGEGPTSSGPIGAQILSVHDTPEATAFVADATDEYNWRKREKTLMLWHPDLDVSNTWLKDNGWDARRNAEPPFLPAMRWYYEGYGHPDYGNWHGETRGLERYHLEDRSIDKAIRTVHLARGKFPYFLIFDDFRADDGQHLYESLLKVIGNIESRNGDDIIIAKDEGTARLLVRVLHTAAPYEVKMENVQAPYGNKPSHNRLNISTTAVEPEFRILVYPHRAGDALPSTTWSKDGKQLTVTFPGQEDTYTFGVTDRSRMAYTMKRAQKLVVDVDAQPAAPQLADRELWMGRTAGFGGHESAPPQEILPKTLPFTGQSQVALVSPTPGTVIRYTTDGKEPTAASALYEKPIPLTKTTTIKARAIADKNWPGTVNSSELFDMTFEQRPPAKPVQNAASLMPGLQVELFEVFETIYDNKTGFFTGKKKMLPELGDRLPLLRMMVDGLDTPRAEPVGPVRRMTTGFYRYRGYLKVPSDGVYRFRLHSPGPVRLTLGTPASSNGTASAVQTVVENTGVYYNAERYRYGAAALAAGAHAFELIVADPDFFRHSMSPQLNVTLDMAAPGSHAFTPVPATDFFCDPAPKIVAGSTHVGSATVVIEPAPNAEVRYTLTNPGLVLWPVSQDWPTAASSICDGPITLNDPGHYVVTAAAFDKQGKQVSPAVQKRIAILPSHEATAVVNPQPGLTERVFETLKSESSDFHALALEELDLEGRKPLQQSVVADIGNAANERNKPLLVYTGYFEAPADGFYRFDLSDSKPLVPTGQSKKVAGIYRLAIDGIPVIASRLAGPDPLDIIYLKKGLHPVRLDLVDGKLNWTVVLPGQTKPIPVSAGMLRKE